MKAPRKKVFVWIGAALIAIFILGAGLAYAADRTAPSRPLVFISGTFPEEAGVSGQPVVVFAQASDPDGIARVELWINGQLTAAQDNPDEGPFPFAASQAWIPTGPGTYLVVLRAVDRKGFTGDSDPFIVQVYEREYGSDEEDGVEYIAQEGDTIESLATAFDLSPEELIDRNPDLGDLAPGSILDVPHVPEEEADGLDAPSAAGEEFPRVDPPAPPPAPDEPAEEAEPRSADWWTLPPLPINFGCLFQPESCRVPIEGHAPPFPAPDGLSVASGPCDAELSWRDNSENELGFRVYRFTMRPRFRFEIVALLEPNPGSGTRVSFHDFLRPTGTFFYAVVAYNAGGQTWSAASPEVANDCPPASFRAGGDQALAIEGLRMDLEGSFERLYCYASIRLHSPFERIPHGADNFILLDSAGNWDIASQFSGRNKRTIFAQSGIPLPITVECLGWQGEELINLGRFERQHPREEWDGRELVGSPDGGGFTLTYRILPALAAVDERGRTDWPLIDPAVSPPFNVHDTDRWWSCTRSPGGSDTCTVPGFTPGLTWDYHHIDGETGELVNPTAFRVYRRFEGGSIPRHYYTVLDGWPNSAPLFSGGCAGNVFYSVSAVIGADPLTGEEIQTPLSEEFQLPSCATLEITLNSLWVPEGSVRDGDIDCGARTQCQTYEAYGWIMANDQRIIWNNHCDPGAFGTCLGPGPSTTSVRAYGSYSWSDMVLNTGGSWRRDNNVIRIPIQTGEILNLTFELWDHDSTSGDDRWCYKGFRWWPNREIEDGDESSDWTVVDEVFSVEDYRCYISFRVRGLPAE